MHRRILMTNALVVGLCLLFSQSLVTAVEIYVQRYPTVFEIIQMPRITEGMIDVWHLPLTLLVLWVCAAILLWKRIGRSKPSVALRQSLGVVAVSLTAGVAFALFYILMAIGTVLKVAMITYSELHPN